MSLWYFLGKDDNDFKFGQFVIFRAVQYLEIVRHFFLLNHFTIYFILIPYSNSLKSGQILKSTVTCWEGLSVV